MAKCGSVSMGDFIKRPRKYFPSSRLDKKHQCLKCGGSVSKSTVKWAREHNAPIICWKCNHKNEEWRGNQSSYRKLRRSK